MTIDAREQGRCETCRTVWFLAAGIYIGLIAGTIAAGCNRIANQISRQNSLYLCVESAKLHIKSTACDAVLGTPTQNAGE